MGLKLSMNNILNKYIIKFKNPKTLIIAGVAGILLIYLSSFFTGNSESETEKVIAESVSLSEYREQLEDDICEMVKEITGNKNVSVIITLESGIRYSYADIKEESVTSKTATENESNETEFKNGYITVKDADGSEKALLVTENMPEIRGVAIVCAGGDNEIINDKIKNAVTAAFNITSKRVYICGGSR